VSKGDDKDYVSFHTSANILQQVPENGANFPVRRFRFLDDYMKLTQS
jgi:hypothetical protein